MTDKELRRLKKYELLEILYEQEKEISRLNDELSAVKEELEEKKIKIESSGSIAEACLKLTSIFEEAQKAADQYLYNIRQREVEEAPKYVEDIKDEKEEFDFDIDEKEEILSRVLRNPGYYEK